MKKSDLKTGMVVETAAGEKYLVMLNPDCKGRDLISFEGGWMDLDSYDKNLKVICGKTRFDINKVYTLGMSIASLFLQHDIPKYDLIWERKENPVEMTIEEIEKKLGIKNLKIVKE